MAALTVDELLERLERSSLLEPDRLAEVRAELDPIREEIDPEAYLRRLVKAGSLTKWQVDGLVAGRKRFVLGNYRLLDQLGRGGMGAVFKAEHVRLKRHVALKVMAPELMNRPEQVARFQQEIEAAAALDSPHVVRAIDAEQTGKSHILVMELVEGEPVERIVRRRGRLPSGEACEYIRQAAIGLQHAHECGMVHRDIKPGNLIHTWTGELPLIKVFDLGLARFVSERVDKSEMTRTGQVMGTPDYMSPEQGWDTKTVDIRGDIYSLGCSLFRMITGRVPFTGDNPLQTLMARCSADAPLIRTFLPEVDEKLEAVIAKMLARDPARRFQTPGEVAEALAPFSEKVDRKAFRQLDSRRLEPVDRPDSESASETMTAGETGYEQFLNSNSDRTPPDGLSAGLVQPEGAGEPTINIAEDSGVSASRASVRPKRESSGGAKPMLIAGGGIAALVLVGIVAFAVSGGDEETKPGGTKGQSQANSSSSASWKFEDVAEQQVDEGKELRVRLSLNKTKGEGPRPTIVLAGEAIEGLRFDATSSELVWTPAEVNGPGEFRLSVEARLPDQKNAVASQTVTVHVNEVDRPPDIAKLAPQRVQAGSELKLQISASDPDFPEFGLRYRLAPGAPDGAEIDHATGEFRWTPAANHPPGKVSALILVTAANAPQLAAGETIHIEVLAGTPAFKLLPVSEQTIEAGQLVRVPLRTQPPASDDGKVAFRLVSSKPGEAGQQVKFNSSSGVFSWQTDSSTKPGRYEFTAQAAVEGDLDQADSVTFAVVVAKPAATTAGDSHAPTDEQIAEADKEARDLFRREIVAARSLNERVALASRLLNRAKESGNSPLAFVLYRMAREYAVKGRSVAIALETVRLSSERFDVDPVSLSVESVAAYRPKGATWFDRQQIQELGLHAAKLATDRNRFADAETLIESAESVARQTREFETADQLRKALEFARKLKKDVPERTETASLSESSRIGRSELLGVLGGFEFRPLFESLDNASFFRHSKGDLPDRGRSLWKVNESELLLESPMQEFNTGFAERSRSLTAFTLRMNVAADSTAGMLCIGLPQTGGFEGVRLHLGSSQFCFLRTASGTEFLARPSKPIARNQIGWDQVEVRAAPGQISIRVNDETVIDTTTDAQLNGFLGLDAYLGAAAPSRLRLENIRVRLASAGANE